MIQYLPKTITLTAVTMITILTLTLPSSTFNGFSQTDIQTQKGEEVAIKFQLGIDEDFPIPDVLKPSNFEFVPITDIALCPTSDCEYEFENGNSIGRTGDRTVFGTFKVDTGEVTKIMELSTSYKALEEREVNGETIQVVEGKLDIGKEKYKPEFSYKINGTETTDGENFIVELRGTK